MYDQRARQIVTEFATKLDRAAYKRVRHLYFYSGNNVISTILAELFYWIDLLNMLLYVLEFFIKFLY